MALHLKYLEIPTLGLLLFLGTAILIVGPGLAIENPFLSNNDPIYSAILVALMVVVCVLSALDISGGLFNPMLASVLFGGCQVRFTYILFINIFNNSLMVLRLYYNVYL